MIVDEHIQTNEAEKNSKKLNDPDENDPVVNEIDVYLSRSLSNNVYVLQVKICLFIFFKITNIHREFIKSTLPKQNQEILMTQLI
jgi:hypothetical protein